MSVSKRLRFEILRRDNHTCRYCGSAAPDAPITVDHVVAVALGGSDDPSNLVAACKDCNGGKSSMPADASMVSDVASDAIRWAAAIKQAADEMALQDNTQVYEAVVNAWTSFRRNQIPGDYRETIDQFLNAGLPPDDIVQMARVADAKPSLYNRWSYFCGCCWKRLGQLQERAAELVAAPEVVNPFDTVTHLTTRWSQYEIDEFLSETVKLVNDKTGRDISVADLTCEHGDSCDDVLCRVCCASTLSAFFHTPEELSG